MKITFILTAIGKKPGKPYIKTWKIMEPLTIMTLKALTPPDIETEFFDDRRELINYDTKTDLVAITCETYTAYRAYSIAKRFRERGIPVILGGYHVTSIPDEAKEYADAIIIGNAENIWAQCLADFREGKLKPVYKGVDGFSNILPDRSIIAGRNYAEMALIETGRGCVFNCEFCSIMQCYNSKYYQRDIRSVVEDIERADKKYNFLIDDNIVANPQYALKLCKEIAPLKVKWVSQGSLTMAKNPELLKWLKKSGCQVVLIGIESLEEENLKQMHKEWSTQFGDQEQLIRRIHDEGLNIYATFVFGFDYDTPATFDKAVDFSLRHDFFFTAFNHITPFPGTPLYNRLAKEGRLLSEKWWMNTSYRYGDLPFRPKTMEPEEVTERCAQARKDFFRSSSIAKRLFSLIKRNQNPFFSLLFLAQNMNMQREVNQKLELPIGTGLDELPK